MRALAICAALVGWGLAAAPSGASASPPGFRLPLDVAPLSYDLTLEIDPARDAFEGHVVISIAASPGTTQLWLHAVDLAIVRAQLRSGGREEDVVVLPDGGDQLRGFALPHPAGTDPIALVIDYTGHARERSGRGRKADYEGLFRKREAGRWYLYSQSESIFARKIVPCFDEPRFKPAWRVTTIVPRDLVALANAPVTAERALPDGRREVRFAEIPRMPSYLLAIAVGPFDIVDVGKLGRAHVPVRVATIEDRQLDGLALRELPRIIDALESYLDAPLPVVKLDLVAVPGFGAAMENLGLITFDAGMFDQHDVFDAYQSGMDDFISVAAHELAHQWFGNAVTPAWWDHIWLSEGLVTWLSDRTAAALRPGLPPAAVHGARVAALAADEQPGARSIIHPIASSDDIEPAFDAIAYQKAAAVLAMFERFVGPDAFRAAIRSYLGRHAGTSVTSQAFIDAFAAATTPASGAALASNLLHPGLPVVKLDLRCGAHPAIVASVRGAVTVPVCVWFPIGNDAAQSCFLTGPHSELALPAAAGCPAWVVGNDRGVGYYRTMWRRGAPHPPGERLSPEERLVLGDDVAAAVRHGDMAIPEALEELTRLAAMRVPDSEVAALLIAEAIDPMVTDPVRPAWATWLAARFAMELSPAVLAPSRSPSTYVVRAKLVRLVRSAVAPATLRAARTAVDAAVRPYDYQARLELAAVRDPIPLFEQMVRAAATERGIRREDRLRALGVFPGDVAPRLIDTLLDPRFSAAQVWPALAAMFRRGDAAREAWRALHRRLDRVIAVLPADRVNDVIEATGSLCDAHDRAEVAADLTPRVAMIRRGRAALDHALATIDRCIARRTAAGDIARALAIPVPGQPGTQAP